MEDLREQIASAADAAQDAHDAVKAATGPVAASVAFDGSDTLRLTEAIATRDEACLAFGRAMLAWIIAGGELVLEEAPTEAVVAAPVEDVAPVEITLGEDLDPTPPPSPPATAAQLAQLANFGVGSAAATKPELSPHELLKGWMDMAGPPLKVETAADYMSEAERIKRVVDRIDDWSKMPKYLQKMLIGYVSSKCQHLDDEVAPDHRNDLYAHTLIPAFISRMAQWSKVNRPGWVPGLGTQHEPTTHKSWLHDEHHWWDQMQEDVTPRDPETRSKVFTELKEAIAEGAKPEYIEHILYRAVGAGWGTTDRQFVDLFVHQGDVIPKGRKFATLRGAVLRARQRAQGDADRAFEEDVRISPVPEDWSLFDKTEGKAALILGGEPRTNRVDAIRDSFKFGDVMWGRCSNIRQTTSNAEAVRNGKYDYVILIRSFASHTSTNIVKPATKEAGVPIIVVPTGYGVSQIKAAFEHYFGA